MRDAHRYRVGVNAEQLPVNAAALPRAHTITPTAPMRLARHIQSRCLLRAELVQRPGAGRALHASRRCKISGDADRYNHRDGNDDYRQPGDLFRLMTADQKEQLFHNYKAAMHGVPVEIVKRQIAHFYRADPGIRHRRRDPHGPFAPATCRPRKRRSDPASTKNFKRSRK